MALVWSYGQWSSDDERKALLDGWMFVHPSYTRKFRVAGDGEKYHPVSDHDLIFKHIADRAAEGDAFYQRAWAIIVRAQMEDDYID